MVELKGILDTDEPGVVHIRTRSQVSRELYQVLSHTKFPHYPVMCPTYLNIVRNMEIELQNEFN